MAGMLLLPRKHPVARLPGNKRANKPPNKRANTRANKRPRAAPSPSKRNERDRNERDGTSEIGSRDRDTHCVCRHRHTGIPTVSVGIGTQGY